MPGAIGTDDLRRKRAGYAVFGLAATLALGFAMGWNPPTSKVHSFTEDSVYDAEKESGCVDSGEGCHGDEETFADFNDYHPDAECTDCHEYQGVGCIPCHKPKEHECVLCHDGSKEGIADVVRLSDPYPRGHYRETTHTATATDMTREVRSAEGGKASAACGDCHSRDLRESHTGVPSVPGSPYGADVGCGECHNDVRSRGMAEVLSDWKGRGCEDCHAVGTSSPMHGAEVAGSAEASASPGCSESGSGCHEGSDLHAMHPDAPGTCAGSAADGEPGCHDLEVESHEPTATTCGAAGGESPCHAGYPPADLGHENDREVHSPSTNGPASATSEFGIACGRCHHMDPDGVSLLDEHALRTSERTNVPDDLCRDCHNDPSSAEAIADDWERRDSGGSCDACHGREGLDGMHEADLAAVHVAESSGGCADSGPGCHPTSRLDDVGEPTVDGGLHANCLRCHDRTGAEGGAYDPSADSCGRGRDCHAHPGAFAVDGPPVHVGASGRVDGSDGAHTAGREQAGDVYTDALTSMATRCDACHARALGTEHDRPNASTSSASDVCRRCHDDSLATARVVKAGWPARDSDRACEACHDGSGAEAPHARTGSVHAGTELALDGTPTGGACVGAGCHAEPDLRSLHANFGCTARGCHSSSGDIRGKGLTSCGGMDPAVACHAGYSGDTGHKDLDAIHAATERDTAGVPSEGFCAKSGCHPSADVRKVHEDAGCTIHGCHREGGPDRMSCGGNDREVSCHRGVDVFSHRADHSADLTGTVDGVTYAPGANVGCFGCHDADLSVEHARELGAGGMDGEAGSGCRVCHFEDDDPTSGPYSDAAAVRRAIEQRDLRCVACHSGGAEDGPDAVASPHRDTSSADELPAGKVWSDPLDDWRAAFDAMTGSGHNSVDAGVAGSASAKRFPLTSFDIGGRTYTWELPPNSGATRWLRADVFGDASGDAAIQRMDVGCDDCHVVPEEAAGPHGASVRVQIDPEYSQTEYANPTTASYQFYATGTDRVVCFKCHDMQAAWDGSSSAGGHPVHGRHTNYTHHDYPAPDPRHWGAKCIDCHVRIPHAWKRPRLLVRTVETTDGVEPDGLPYADPDAWGLKGIVLRDFTNATPLDRASCAVGGCYDSTRPHPHPEDIPGAEYWP